MALRGTSKAGGVGSKCEAIARQRRQCRVRARAARRILHEGLLTHTNSGFFPQSGLSFFPGVPRHIPIVCRRRRPRGYEERPRLFQEALSSEVLQLL